MQIKNDDTVLKNALNYACEALQLEFRKQYVDTVYIQEKLDVLDKIRGALEAKAQEERDKEADSEHL